MKMFRGGAVSTVTVRSKWGLIIWLKFRNAKIINDFNRSIFSGIVAYNSSTWSVPVNKPESKNQYNLVLSSTYWEAFINS